MNITEFCQTNLKSPFLNLENRQRYVENTLLQIRPDAHAPCLRYIYISIVE